MSEPSDDLVFVGDDSCLFVADHYLEKTVGNSTLNLESERQQAEAVKSGNALRQQLKFGDYLTKRGTDSSYTFRQHLRKIGGESKNNQRPMNSSYYLQSALGLTAGAIMCGAWWYAVVKFPRTWIFSGLAIIATISILLYAGVLLLIASGNTSGLISGLSSVQVLIHLAEAILFILLVRWLVSNAGKS